MPRPSIHTIAVGLAMLALAAVPQGVAAQKPAAAQSVDLFGGPPVPGAASLGELYRGSPGTSGGSPFAFGAGMGDMFVGAIYMPYTRGVKNANGSFTSSGVENDMSISLGFGLGDANEFLSLTTVVTSMSTFKSNGGNTGALSFHLAHNIDPTFAIGLGVENAAISGGDKSGSLGSWYAVTSKVYNKPSADMAWLNALTVSAGIGNGRFRFVDDVRDKNKTVNVFGSASALVHEQISVILDWTGQDLAASVSVVPFKKFPIVITPSLVDIAGLAYDVPRFVISAALGVHF